jgi:hypothetical protein
MRITLTGRMGTAILVWAAKNVTWYLEMVTQNPYPFTLDIIDLWMSHTMVPYSFIDLDHSN